MKQVLISEELLRQAFDYLNCAKDGEWDGDTVAGREMLDKLRNVLEQPAVEPVAWRWAYKGQPDSDKCFPMPVPDQDVQDVAKMRAFPRTVQLLYAAPQAQQPASNTDIPDLIAGTLGVSRGTAYDLMREALEAQQPRKAVKLTDDDLNAIGCVLDFYKWRARAIEQAVLKKNGVTE